MTTLRTFCSGGDLFGDGAAAAGWRVVDGYEINDKIAAAPAFTSRDGSNGSPERVVLLGDQSARDGDGVLMRRRDESGPQHWAGRGEVYRAGEIGGEWRRLTLPCLARLQTVPEDYKGLTTKINGNGVPPLFAQRLMEALR